MSAVFTLKSVNVIYQLVLEILIVVVNYLVIKLFDFGFMYTKDYSIMRWRFDQGMVTIVGIKFFRRDDIRKWERKGELLSYGLVIC